MNIEINCHSSIKIIGDKIIYVDPFRIKENKNDADIIFITHDHYDHYSLKDIEKIKKQNTIIVMPKHIERKDDLKDAVIVMPNKKYEVDGINVETIPSYNINKPYHPKENNWVGYILNIEGKRIYIPGDTDITEENMKVQCDIIFVPIGGTYTMNYEEGAKLTNIIKPKIAIPVHYGEIVGKKEDAEEFKKLLEKDIECKILIK